jgi:hypothetical protein
VPIHGGERLGLRAVVLREAREQIAFHERALRRPDPVERPLLHEHVRRLRDHRPDQSRVVRRREERDGAAVAVPEEDRALDPDLVEDPRQDRGLLVQVLPRPRTRTERIRRAMASPIVDEHLEPGRLHEPLGEVPPEPDGAKRIVEEHEDGPTPRARGREADRVELHAIEDELHRPTTVAHRVSVGRRLRPGDARGAQPRWRFLPRERGGPVRRGRSRASAPTGRAHDERLAPGVSDHSHDVRSLPRLAPLRR